MMRTLSIGVGLLVLLAIATGAAAGQTATQTPTDTSTAIIDQNVQIDGDTEAVWYEVAAVSDLGGDTLDASVTFEGLESGQSAGEGTELATETVTISTGGETATGSYSLADTDADTYESIRVHVDGTDSTDVDLVDSSDYGLTERVSGGGGGWLGGDGSGVSIGAIAVVAIGGLYFFGRD
jgi:hypothetical protein